MGLLLFKRSLETQGSRNKLLLVRELHKPQMPSALHEAWSWLDCMKFIYLHICPPPHAHTHTHKTEKKNTLLHTHCGSRKTVTPVASRCASSLASIRLNHTTTSSLFKAHEPSLLVSKTGATNADKGLWWAITCG